MRLNKTTAAAGCLVLTLALFVGLHLVPKSNSDKFLGNPILDSKHLVEITKIRIEDSKAGFDMVKDNRGEWVLPADANFPVNAHKVSQLLDYMMGQKITQSLEIDPKDYALVGLENPLKVTLFSDKGAFVHMGVGALRKQAGQYIYLQEPSRSYLIEYQFELQAEAKEWWQKDLWQIPEEKIRSIQLSFPSSPGRPLVKLFRENERSEWQLENLPKGRAMLPHLRIGFVDGARGISFYERTEVAKLAPRVQRKPDVVMEIVQFDDTHIALDVFRFPKEKSDSDTPAWVRPRLVKRSVASTLPPDVDPYPHWKQWYFRLYNGMYDRFDMRPIDFSVQKKSGK